MAFTKLIYHIVFAPKYRRSVIDQKYEKDVYFLIYNLCIKSHVKVWRIGGMPDHIHLLVQIPPTMAVSDFVAKLKRESSYVINHECLLPDWEGWGSSFCALSYSENERQTIINYIMNQKKHHSVNLFDDELKAMLKSCGINEDSREYKLLFKE